MDIPRLHPDTVGEVKQRVDIVDVISDYVVLKRQGKNYLGLCPFHQEKSPSFSVSPDKQLYYCFGCGAGGDTVKFLIEQNKQSFTEVVLDLAKRYGVPIQTLQPKQRQELQRQITLKEQLYEILAVAANFYQHALRQPENAHALDYLISERRLQDKTIAQFGLGYAPGGWETLHRYLVEQKRYSAVLVEQAGLTKARKSGNGYYDQFRDRLMIPIMDISGKTIGFGSRTLGDEQPKYLNSPQTPLFDKGKTLFALDSARQSIIEQDQAIVVEGYFDAIALHAAGITNAVACLGTALTTAHLKQLLRYTESKQVVLNFDADAAGEGATQRAIDEVKDLVYTGQAQLRVLQLPEGKDADEWLQRESAVDAYRELVKKAPLWLDWQIKRFLTDTNLDSATDLQQVAQKMVNLLAQIRNLNLRNYYLRNCAEFLSQGESKLVPQNVSILQTQLKSRTRSQSGKSSRHRLKIATNPENQKLAEAEALLLRLYLHCPAYRQDIITRLETQDLVFSVSAHRLLWQQIMMIEHQSQQDADLIGQLQNSITDELSDKEINHLFYLDEKTKEDVFRSEHQINEAIISMKQIAYQKYQLYCERQIQQLNPLTNADSLQHYYQEIVRIKEEIEQLHRANSELV